MYSAPSAAACLMQRRIAASCRGMLASVGAATCIWQPATESETVSVWQVAWTPQSGSGWLARCGRVAAASSAAATSAMVANPPWSFDPPAPCPAALPRPPPQAGARVERSPAYRGTGSATSTGTYTSDGSWKKAASSAGPLPVLVRSSDVAPTKTLV